MASKFSRSKAADPLVIFKVLADENRYRALKMLARARNGLPVGEIAETLGMGHSAASHLLAVLHRVGVVSFRKEGRVVRYMLDKGPAARMLLRVMQAS